MAQYIDPRKCDVRSAGSMFGGAVSKKHINRYKRNPGAPVIAERLSNGRYRIVDGAHRVAAARQAGRRVAAHVGPERPGHNYSSGCGLLLATGGTAAVLGSSTWLALSGYLA